MKKQLRNPQTYVVKNVTVVNNLAVDGGGGINAGSMGDYAIIANSIFWNNQPTNADGMIFPYYSNIDIPVGTNNIFIDPLFIDDGTTNTGTPVYLEILSVNDSPQIISNSVNVVFVVLLNLNFDVVYLILILIIFRIQN